MKLIILAMSMGLMLGGCGGSDVPKVSDRYQERIQEAWDKADKGESPTHTCARVIGVAVGLAGVSDDNRQDAAEAYEACYVDVQAHWVRRTIELADAEQSPCYPLRAGLMTSRMSLGGFAEDLGLDVETLNARIADMVRADVEQACPNQAEGIVGRKA